ncbi:uncharacterized protein LOC18447141 [Amborella trichopoda]|nr:uncharacterized protein LOC18447141 [Amborella trichopoda]XP_011628098.1 uncharacterized protein LOC18447141 [Amborella trichopoda]XP_020531111.1 uncharacterized protein LOC18447141 [Amborella trichopoda]|eukprot:XP_006857305.2 uncharacterized protein LOC18447141 [Amborella trichopoda]
MHNGMPMGPTNKDLLDLEQQKPSFLESKLSFCSNETTLPINKKQPNNGRSGTKLVTAPVPSSQVLGKVKDFLGVMAEANKKLELSVQETRADPDIEVLTGKEQQYIEMDLVLGVADLYTPEAVAAAESALSGTAPAFSVHSATASSSGSGTSSSSDGDDSDSDESSGSPDKCEEPTLSGDLLKRQDKRKKRPKITELQ